MPTAAAVTIAYMIDPLPPHSQEQVVDHLRNYIEDMREETQWNDSFSKTQDTLVAMANRARLAIKEGKASPMDISQL